MKLPQLIEKLDAELIAGNACPETEYHKVGASDFMSDILAAALSEGSVLLTGLTTVQAVKTAVISGVGAVGFVRGKKPPQEVIDVAQTHGIPLLSTPCSMFISCGRLYAEGFTGLNGKR
ncbi:MAG: hypothetical protein ACQERN_02520 [Thermodesulfobacteriota bacterium]